MHPAMLRQHAADHIQDLVIEAGGPRRAREARRARRHRPPAQLRRSTRLYAQQRQSRPVPGTMVEPGADDRVESCRP